MDLSTAHETSVKMENDPNTGREKGKHLLFMPRGAQGRHITGGFIYKPLRFKLNHLKVLIASNLCGHTVENN